VGSLPTARLTSLVSSRVDEIVAVDGKPVEGQKLRDVVAAIRGEVGTSVKLALSRQGQSREVSLTRVAPEFGHPRHHIGDGWEIEDHDKLGRGNHSPNE
jgi:C-terminal processing protease CtpA/Prc